MPDASLPIRRIDENNYEVNLTTRDYSLVRVRRLMWTFKVVDGDGATVHRCNIDGDLEKALRVVHQYYLGGLT